MSQRSFHHVTQSDGRIVDAEQYLADRARRLDEWSKADALFYKVTPKTVYGNKLYYPACKFAQLICDLTQSKTITIDTMQRLYKDGYYPVGDSDWSGSYITLIGSDGLELRAYI